MTQRRERRQFNAEFKTRIVIESLRERETIQQIAQKHDVHPNQISQWRREFLDNATKAFDDGGVRNAFDEKERDRLLAKIGELQVSVDFLKKIQY
ncbi:MAG: transposase [Flavobacteriales bacterium]